MVDRVQENPKYKKTKKQEICITGFKFSTRPLHAKPLVRAIGRGDILKDVM